MSKKRRYRPTQDGWIASSYTNEEAERTLKEHREIFSDERLGFINHSMSSSNALPRRAAPNMVAIADRTSGVHTRYQGSQARADRRGYADLGTFLVDVVKGSKEDSGSDAIAAQTRLTNALSTYGNEGVGADGGFAVPPAFSPEIMQKVTEEGLLRYCDVSPTENMSVQIPKDETSPWGSSGIQGYWDGEAGTYTQRKPVLEHSSIKLNKLSALCPVTDELLEDAPAMGPFVQKRAVQALDWKVTDAIINGSGAGQPLGILNSAHTITVSKESSQVADTIHGLNLIKMWARMPAAWRANAVWLVHPDAEPQLQTAGLQITNAANTLSVGGSLVYVAPGGIADSPYGSLFGRPVIPTQACAALGDVGDIIFADLAQYAAFVRSPGLTTETSIHIWFDQGVTAFRFTLRIGGQPWWSTPISNKNGSGTQSGFIALEAR